MILIVAVDDRNGMTFNKRRQSQDAVLRDMILEMTKNSKLWMNHYSAKQFTSPMAPQINVTEDFLSEAAPGEYCFVENVAVATYEKWIEKIVLCKWNRAYPGDQYFDIDLTSGWKLENAYDFHGSSHEKITMEVYTRA